MEDEGQAIVGEVDVTDGLAGAGFECMVEILYRAARLGLRISEVPMVLDGSRRVGKSKMKVVRTSVAYLGLAFRALTGRL